MKITIESTNRIVELRARRWSAPAIQCRVWEGKTESGIPVQCLIPRIATPEAERQDEFQAELKECRAPEAEPQAFPMRLLV